MSGSRWWFGLPFAGLAAIVSVFGMDPFQVVEALLWGFLGLGLAYMSYRNKGMGIAELYALPLAMFVFGPLALLTGMGLSLFYLWWTKRETAPVVSFVWLGCLVALLG